jgi:hypothetical protein
MPDAVHHIEIRASPGRSIRYAIERLCDCRFYHFPSGRWRPAREANYLPVQEVRPGQYRAILPLTETGREYCVHIADERGRLLAIHLLDGDYRPIDRQSVRQRNRTEPARGPKCEDAGMTLSVCPGRFVETD